MTPVPAAEHGARRGEADAPGQPADQCRTRVPGGDPGIVIWLVGRVGPGTVDHGRVVGRDVDRLRLRRFDDDVLRFAAYHLLLVRLQVAVVLRQLPQALDRRHDVILLGEEGVAEFLGPVELFVHHFKHVGEGDQRLDADVPAFALDLLDGGVAVQLRVGLGPARRLHDFERVRGSHQNLGEQRIGVEGDRRQQGVEFLRLEWCRGGVALRMGRRGQHNAGGQPPQHEGAKHFHCVLLGGRSQSC